jgi:hypothetical protein
LLFYQKEDCSIDCTGLTFWQVKGQPVSARLPLII